MRVLNYIILLFCCLFFPITAIGADITENLSISGTATTVYQWLKMSKGYMDEEKTKKREDRGSAVIDFNVSFRPIENGEFFTRWSFAKGSGFKSEGSQYPFSLSPNADDLFVDLKNINNHPRDHLLELWYSHKFELMKDTTLKLTAGVIDAGAFIDDNKYAGDEIAQFMNEVFVHSPLANLPSYDLGLAGELEIGDFHLRAVGIRSKNDDDRRYNWIGGQIGYRIDTPLGEGNYRLYGYVTNKRFFDWDEEGQKALKGIGVSFDQELIKESVGAFFRWAVQDTKARDAYFKSMYSIGVNLSGGIWGRKDDEVAVGYAYLRAPHNNENIRSSQVIEGYVKFKLFSYKSISSDISFDYQHVREKAREEGTKSANIYGVRFNVHF